MQRIVSHKVPVQVCRYIDEEVVRKVPVQVTRMVEEQQVRKVPVTTVHQVVERVPQQVAVQVCKMVEEEVVRKVPVTTCRMAYEERVEQIPVQVCKMVAVQETMRMPHAGERIPVTYTCRTPRVVCMRVPLEATACCDSGVQTVLPITTTPATIAPPTTILRGERSRRSPLAPASSSPRRPMSRKRKTARPREKPGTARSSHDWIPTRRSVPSRTIRFSRRPRKARTSRRTIRTRLEVLANQRQGHGQHKGRAPFCCAVRECGSTLLLGAWGKAPTARRPALVQLIDTRYRLWHTTMHHGFRPRELNRARQPSHTPLARAADRRGGSAGMPKPDCSS